MAIIEEEVNQFLILNQTNNSNIKGLSILQTLTLNENQKTQKKFIQIKHQFNLAQTITLKKTIHLKINQSIPFYQNEAKVKAQESIIQIFYPWQRILITPTGIINQTLQINQNIISINTHGIIDTLNLIQSIGINKISLLTVINTLNLIQGPMNSLNEECGFNLPYILDGPNSTGGDVF